MATEDLRAQFHEVFGGKRDTATAEQRPSIDAGNHDLETVSDEAWQALQQANEPPRLFTFGGIAVRVGSDTEDAPPEAQSLTEDRLRHEVDRAAHWVKMTKKGVEEAAPPRDVIRDMLAYPRYPLPRLAAVVRAPVVAPDGHIETTPGYHCKSMTYYAPAADFVMPDVPVPTSGDDMARAKGLLLDELLGEFPFSGDADRAHAVALALGPFLRPLILGPTPLHMIEAPTPGSGKSLLLDVLAGLSQGRDFALMPAADDDDEWRKRLTSVLLRSPAMVAIDNIMTTLDAGSLSAALTLPRWQDRILGASEMVRFPIRCVWAATANNPTMSLELARRTVRIRLDAKVDRPWQRSGFRHENLRSWAHEQRGELVWAALTLIRAWVDADRPRSTAVLGSFEEWAAIMGGILNVAGIDGFLGNLEEFYESADSEGGVWRAFVAAWAEKHSEQEVGVADLFTLATEIEGFDFGKGNERAQRITFGKQLGKRRDQVIGEWRLVQTREVKRLKQWRLMRGRAVAFYDHFHQNGQHAHADQQAYSGTAGDDRWT